MLNIKDTLPAGFFEAGPKNLNKLLGGSFSFENGAGGNLTSTEIREVKWRRRVEISLTGTF